MVTSQEPRQYTTYTPTWDNMCCTIGLWQLQNAAVFIESADESLQTSFTDGQLNESKTEILVFNSHEVVNGESI